jgi:hypothetical protein
MQSTEIPEGAGDPSSARAEIIRRENAETQAYVDEAWKSWLSQQEPYADPKAFIDAIARQCFGRGWVAAIFEEPGKAVIPDTMRHVRWGASGWLDENRIDPENAEILFAYIEASLDWVAKYGEHVGPYDVETILEGKK